jgi:YVTN family beta-propeller protein
VYVTAETSSIVSVIDARANRVVTNLLADLRPRATAFSPDGTRAYVTNEVSGSLMVIGTRTHQPLRTACGLSNEVDVIDTATNRVIARIPVGTRPWGVAITR